MEDNRTAILLLGHGSRVPEANQVLHAVAEMVRGRMGCDIVEVAFREQHAPDIQKGIDACVARGARRILLVPYFLFAGAHVLEDLPGEIEEGARRHPDLEMALTEPLGLHPKLGDIVCQRIRESLSRRGWSAGFVPAAGGIAKNGGDVIVDPSAIEARSFEIIEQECGNHGFNSLQWPVVRRIIHAAGDPDFLGVTLFSPDAVKAGLAALNRGEKVFCDTRMVEAGINKRRLKPFGSEIRCHIGDPETAGIAASEGITRSMASVRRGAAEGCGIYIIGNAPTALFELLRLTRSGAANPSLVIGIPVGFVGAAESKEALIASGLPFITCRGRKGGSATAVAAFNALIIQAREGIS